MKYPRLRFYKARQTRLAGNSLAPLLILISLAPEPTHSAVLEEVIVTARKSLESLQDVPASVANFGSEALQDSGITDISGIANLSPSVVFAPSPGVGVNPQVAIRGQVQNDATVLTVDPAVGIYLDDVYLGRSPGSLLDMFDISRVEVLKGPQGTLYGRNTTGGALKVIPRKAIPGGEWEGFVRAMKGNHDQSHTEGAVNLPLLSDLAARLSYSKRELGGYANATLVAPDNPEDILKTIETGAKDTDSFRVNVVWDASDKLLVELGYDSTDTVTNGAPSYEQIGDRARASAGIITRYERSSDDHYSYFTDVETKANALTDGAYLKASYEFPWAEVKTVIAQRNLDYEFTIDPDGTSARGVFTDTQQKVEQTSYELQLSGFLWNDRIQWIVGYYDFEEDGNDKTFTFASDVVAGAALSGLPNTIQLPATGTAPLLSSTGDADILNTSESGFFQVTWDALEQLSLTAGGRAIKENKGIDITAFDSGIANDALGPNQTNECIYSDDPESGQSNGANAETCYFRQDTDYDYNTWTLSASWNFTNNLMAYVKKSRGVRSGGQNFRGRDAATLVPFDPEFVTDTEVGFKSEFWGSRVRLNASGYKTDYSDIQFSDIVGISTFIDNLGDAEIQGTEVELTVAATDTITAIATGSLTNFEYDDPSLQGPFAPHKKASLSLNYKRPFSWGEFGSNVSYSYSSKVPLDNDAAAFENNPAVSQEAYALVNGTAYIDFVAVGLRLGVFCTNMTDEETYGNALPSFVFTDPLVGGVGTTGSPRFYGIDLTYSFSL